MKKTTQHITTLMAVLLLFACSSDHPKLTHFKAFDERFTTVIDTSDPVKLKSLADLFFNHQVANNVQGNLDFVFLIDISTEKGSTRFRCTKTGFCQLRTEGAEMQKDMIYLEQYRELYLAANLTDK